MGATRVRSIIGSVVFAFLAAVPARAQSLVEGPSVIGCETLVSLRVLMAVAPDVLSATTRLGSHPSCRVIAKTRIGAVESRAMIGGAPFECIAIADERACAWILP